MSEPGKAPTGTTWTAQPDREAQLAARNVAVRLEHARVKQDRAETAASSLPPSLQPATGRPSPTGGTTTWSQARKRPGDAARTAEMIRSAKGET
jgi:hypothetical protein